MSLKFGSENLKGDEIQKNNVLWRVYVNPSVMHLVGTLATRDKTSSSDIGRKAIIYYLSERKDDLTEDEREALIVATEKYERETKQERAKEAYRLSFEPKNLRYRCTQMKNMGRDNSFILNQVIKPTIDGIRLTKFIDVSDILKECEEIERDFSGGSHED